MAGEARREETLDVPALDALDAGVGGDAEVEEEEAEVVEDAEVAVAVVAETNRTKVRRSRTWIVSPRLPPRMMISRS